MPQIFLGPGSSCGHEAAPNLAAKAKNSDMSQLTNVWCPSAMTLKFLPNILSSNVRYGPKYRPCNPIATGTLALEKPRKSVFRQNGNENYFQFRFSLHIPILRGRHGRYPTNLKNDPLTLFREIWPQSWKIQKKYLNELHRSPRVGSRHL